MKHFFSEIIADFVKQKERELQLSLLTQNLPQAFIGSSLNKTIDRRKEANCENLAS